MLKSLLMKGEKCENVFHVILTKVDSVKRAEMN